MNRPTFQPPNAPELPEVARLQVQRAERGVAARRRWLIAAGVCLLATSGGVWATWKALAAGLAWDVVACFGGPVLLTSAAGVVYFGLPLLDEVHRFRLFLASAWQEVELRGQAISSGIDRADDHSRRYFGERPDKSPRVVFVTKPMQEGSRARVVAPEARDGAETAEDTPTADTDTRHLPELPPGVPPQPYYGTVAALLVDRLWAGQPVGRRALTEGKGRVCDRAAWEAARDRLVGAGILAEGGVGRGLVLVPPWDQYGADPTVGHDLIARELGAPPSPTGDRAG